MKRILIFFLVSFACHLASAQSGSLHQINNDVWKNFYKAYELLDVQYMESIHLPEIIRVAADQKQVLSYSEYMASIKGMFEHVKSNKVTMSISLRFLERLCSETVASERGIYKVTINKPSGTDTFYGKFHVILKKEGVWKIWMDYDSNEGNSIGEKEYLAALPLEEVEQ